MTKKRKGQHTGNHHAPGCHLNDVTKDEGVPLGKREKIMVCVTRQVTCERLIRHGAELAEQLDAELLVAHVIRPEERALGNADEGEALEMLSTLTFEYGGEMCMLRAPDVFAGLAECASSNAVDLMVIGSSPEGAEAVSRRLRELLPKVNLIVVDAESESKAGSNHGEPGSCFSPHATGKDGRMAY